MDLKLTTVAALVSAVLAPTYAFAAGNAVDDTVTTQPNTPVVGFDVSANDSTNSSDVYAIASQPQNGTATITSNGLLNYTPNAGFASTDSLVYSVTRGSTTDLSTVTINVAQPSNFISTGSNFLTTKEDTPVPLNITVDPALFLGGALQDIIGTDALFRASNAGSTPVVSAIPANATGINIVGYSTRNVGTSLQDDHNDHYQTFSTQVDLKNGTYSGHLNHSETLLKPGPREQFSFTTVPLGQALLTDTSLLNGNFTGGVSNPIVRVVNGNLEIVDTTPLQTAYHVEYLTSDGKSSDFLSASNAIQLIGDTTSTLPLPAQLEPTDGSEFGTTVVSAFSAANGTNASEEHKGFSRLVIDHEAKSISGVISISKGEGDYRVATYAFTDYPLVDLRSTPGASTTGVIAGSGRIVGDTVVSGAGLIDDPTIFINAAGEIEITRSAGMSGKFTTLYTTEYYQRQPYTSISSFVASVSDTSLFDDRPADGVDGNGKPIDLQTFAIPASAKIGIMRMSWGTIQGGSTNENMGSGFAVIDLETGTTSGSIGFSRATTPDLLGWRNVPIGTTMFGAFDANGNALFQSNKLANRFTDDYAETAQFNLVTNPDGSQTLEFSASSDNGTQGYRDYLGNAQVTWLGSAPFAINGDLNGGVFSHGSANAAGDWEVDFEEIPLMSFIPDAHAAGRSIVTMFFEQTGESETIQIDVEPVADTAPLATVDGSGFVGNNVDVTIGTTASDDADGSESQLTDFTLSNVDPSLTLSSTAGTVTDLGAGIWQVTKTALSSLTATGTTAGTYTIDVSSTNTDGADIDGDGIFEDVNNGSGSDEVDRITVTNSLDITIQEVPTVTSLSTGINNPTISGTADLQPGDVLTVTVAGTTYTAGDGSLVDNGDGTWDLQLTGIADGVYTVVATATTSSGASATDQTANELTVSSALPPVPTVTSQITNNNTPVISGTATLSSGDTLTVVVNGVTYTDGDGDLVVNADGTWDLTLPTATADGTYMVSTAITNSFGNSSSDISSNELIIDTAAPSVPTVVTMVTNNNTPIISGTAVVAVGETLTVTVNGTTYTDGDGDLILNADGTWDLTIPAVIADGVYEVAASVTDTAGNISTDITTDDLTIDTVLPAVPTVSSLITNINTPVISGTANVAAGETLTVSVNGATYTEGDGNLVLNSDGTWDLTIPTPIIDGNYAVTATITDAAGNVRSDITSIELTIDTAAPSIPVANPLTTNNTSPTISGVATLSAGDTLSVTVDGTTYTAGDGNLVANPDGTWDLSIPATLADGVYPVSTTVTDSAGNLSTDISTDELIVDTTSPSTPVVTALVTNNNTPVISGTAVVAAGETLTVTVNGATYTDGDGNLVLNSDGTWDLTIPAAVADGVYQVAATVTDLAGNASTDSATNDLIVDTVLPAAPSVTSLITNLNTPVVSGVATVAAGETLTVSVNGVTYTDGDGNLVLNNDGTWDLTIPTPLVDGSYAVTATVTDAAGNVRSDITSNELTIDTAVPAVPVANPLTTSNTSPTISGVATLAAGETLSVTVNGTTYVSGDGNLVANPDGTWNLSIPEILTDNTYPVTATITDAAGNASIDTTSNELLIDTAPPARPVVTAQTTNITSPTISGSATLAPGEVLTIEVNGTTYSAGDGNLTVNPDGTWDLAIPETLTDGAYPVTATVTDAAGNVNSDITTDELVIDTVQPATPSVTVLSTSNTSPVISGTATLAPGDVLTITVNGTTYTAGDGNLTVNPDGTWDLAIVDVLPDGDYSVTAIITDNAGNISSETTIDELEVDTVAPNVPVVTPLASNSQTPVITGTATLAMGETLSVNVAGVTYTAGDGNLVVNSDGTWELSVPVNLPDGTYPVTATITDSAGNTSNDVSTNELLIDTVITSTPTVTALTTNNASPVVSGTALVAAGETLTVSVNGTTYTAGDGNLVLNADGTWDLTIPEVLADADYEVIATVTDSAGNASADTSTTELTVDTVNPVAPVVASLITNNPSPTVTGTTALALGETLSVTLNGTTYSAGDGYLTVNADGTWELLVPEILIDGVYPVTATTTDAAGNSISDTSTNELTIDTAPPSPPVVLAMVTNDNTPVISGTAIVAAGEALTLNVDGVTYTAGDGNLTLNADGTWDLNVPAAIADGVYEVTATVTDSAGNSSTDSTTNDLTVDTVLPAVPTVTNLVTNINTPVISGSATVAAGETLTVSVDGIAYTAGDGNLVLNADGTWDLTIPTPILDGNYATTVTVTDAAGNARSDITSNELTIDTVVPEIPESIPLTTNITSPVISGLATLGAGETLAVTVNGVTYFPGGGNLVFNADGTWDLLISQTLPDGTYSVTASVTDTSGNVSIDNTADELIIDTVPPAVPVVTDLSTSNTSPVISGIAALDPGDVLTVEVNGTTYTAGDGNLSVNPDGTWNLSIVDVLSDGDYSVTATITDSAGNVSGEFTVNELQIDTLAPNVPVVTPLASNSQTPVITGTAMLAPGETLTVTVGGVTYTTDGGNLIVNSDGTWELSIPPAGLPDGSYAVTATLIDAAGNTTDDISTSELLIDTVITSTPTVTALTTNNASPVVSGTALVAAGETLTVSVNGTTYTAGDGNLVLNADGTWDLTIPEVLTDANYEIVATITDLAGNASTDTTATELTIDTVSPNVPVVVSLITNDPTPIMTGNVTLVPDETLSVTVNGTNYSIADGNLMVNPDGTWELLITDTLIDGVYPVTATVIDAAGNSTVDLTTNELVIDTVLPSIPVVTPLITNATMPVITGTATVLPGETFSIVFNGATYLVGDGNLVLNADGTWALSVSENLADGTYSVTATVTDPAGNSRSDITGAEVIVDTAPPAAPTTDFILSNSAIPVLTGTAVIVMGETLSVEVNGTVYTPGDGYLAIHPDGTWSLNLPENLSDGTYPVTATITDAAGNSSVDITTDELVIDTTAPSVPVVTAVLSNNNMPVIFGTATVAPGETLTVTVNGVTYVAGDGNLVLNADGTWTLTIPEALADDDYEIVAAISDAAGNISTDVSVSELTVDTSAPNAPTVNATTTTDNTPVITGTVALDSGETLTVTVNGTTYVAGDGNLVVNPDGTWELTITEALPDGVYDIVATVTDNAGNTINDVSVDELIIDSTAPAAPTVNALNTEGGSPVLTGTAILAQGDVLTVSFNGTTYTAGDGFLVVNPDGTWILSVADDLADGTYQVVATITDAAGNEISDTSVDEVTIFTPVIVAGIDSDGDGVPDAIDLDADNDGIPNTDEGGPDRDSDGDGIPDYLDLDSDNDGISDLVEVQGEDTNGNHRGDNFIDRDDNGLSDDLQIAPYVLVDTDFDGVPDYLDVDSDNDGITDLVEAFGIDAIYDGRIDELVDADNNGIHDSLNAEFNANIDTDNDGVPNRLDIDSDNDGTDDALEAGLTSVNPLLDGDNDGIPDSVDASVTGGTDSDNDGIDDRFDADFQAFSDTDGDGIIDNADPDANGDGFAENIENTLNAGQALPDLNGDGIPDVFEVEMAAEVEEEVVLGAATGVLQTGLSGRGGCSVSDPANRGSRDPMFAILIAAFTSLWLRRRSSDRKSRSLSESLSKNSSATETEAKKSA